MKSTRMPPLIAHIVFRFDYGGMENGVVNLVNWLPRGEFRHVIIALTDFSEFRARIADPEVEVFGLGKKPGKDWGAYLRLYRLLRRLRPAIVHTRNVGTLDCAVVAALAGVGVRVHGEHGWDVHDPDGTHRKYLLLRRVLLPWVRRVVAVSKDLERWLIDTVGVSARKVRRICNGVDTGRFARAAFSGQSQGPDMSGPERVPAERFPAGCIVIGSVTRFSEIKDPLNLVRAFVELRRRYRASSAAARPDLRLLMAGDGPLRQEAQALLDRAGEGAAAWLPGSRDDTSNLFKRFDVFVLGSRREGISNTVLEAMASGLPVVASATGGNLELIQPGVTGTLVPPGDGPALAAAIDAYVADPVMRANHGAAGRGRVLRDYSLERMVSDYRQLYLDLCPAAAAAAAVRRGVTI